MNKMQKYADKYFLRANQILKADNLNPWVNMQVFVRKGPGKVAGMQEAIDLIVDNSNLVQTGGRIYAKKDGLNYEPKETIMNIIAPVQEIIELETVYLGVLAAEITRQNDIYEVNPKDVNNLAGRIVDLSNPRPVHYFGARHWDYKRDAEISKAAFDAGCAGCSTDEGAATVGQKGGGTIPHALEAVYAWKNGNPRAVITATQAFDKHIDPAVPRIALIDYNNRERTDAYLTAEEVKNLHAVRIDTCGENMAEGGRDGNRKYWHGKGVTGEAVYQLRNYLDNHGYKRVQIFVSSGFSNPEKVKVFNEGEKFLNQRIYDAIGAGFLDNVRTSTADIIAVGNTPEEVDFYNGNPRDLKNIIHKKGRRPRPNNLLEQIV